MNNFTTKTYQMKRKIIKFSNKLCKNKNYEKGYHHTEIIGLTQDMKQIAEENITEELKANNQMKWVQKIYKLSRCLDNLKGLKVKKKASFLMVINFSHINL